MAKNNHSGADHKKKLDQLLGIDEVFADVSMLENVMAYAEGIAKLEKVLVVVSDMAHRKSYIVAGDFAVRLGLNDYRQEDSIWENRILSLIPDEELNEKFISELRFFHYLRRLPKRKRQDYYLVSKLRMRFADGTLYDVLHKMFYVYDADKETVRYAVCIYAPLTFGFKGKSHAVDSLTGVAEELTASANVSILSARERQVVSLIDTGMKSKEIASFLNISIHTVNRHRQEIISKLQVKNSTEACRIAKSMELI
ncbi:MAG: helix-turn-helix transcriptional regulator [Bacteroides sp.]|nr:helix-turn-helix transcriptional regulator [Bacteroides sp.]